MKSLMVTHQSLLTRVDGLLRPLGLTFARYELLRILCSSADGRLPMIVVGRHLQVHPSTLSTLVKRLERDGLIRRTVHPHDGRAFVIELVAPARELTEQAAVTLDQEFFALCKMQPANVNSLLDLLARFPS